MAVLPGEAIEALAASPHGNWPDHDTTIIVDSVDGCLNIEVCPSKHEHTIRQ